MAEEVSFPRGGIKYIKKYNSMEIDNMFVAPHHQVKKNPKKRKRSPSPIDSNANSHKAIYAVSAESLSYKKIQDHMLVLGAVRSIHPLYLEIELPGRVFGKVEVSNLSRPYLNHLRECIENNQVDEVNDMKKLDKLFFTGQILPTKVLNTERSETTNVFLSVDPCDINADRKPTAYKVGSLIWVAVSSISDHGYILDTGNEQCRAFLPFTHTKKNEEFAIGQPIWCIVKECNISSGTCTLKVSSIPEEVIKSTQQDSNLHNMIPGMQFDFIITKILKNGLEGKLSNDTNYCGYVNELYLKKPLHPLKKYKVNTKCKARLLYIEPVTKFMFLTFRRLDISSLQIYPCGAIETVQVLCKTIGGVYVQFPNNEKGFITNKRLIQVVFHDKTNNSLDVVLKRKFKIGSTRQCRVLAYNPFEQMYVCTFEQSMLKETVFTKNDLHVGELVKVKVSEIVAKGLQVQIGQLTGFIQNIHLSNVKFSETIKGTFSVGQTLLVRVWNINSRGIYFTNKKPLIKENSCFTKYEDIKLNHQYLGIVVNIRNNEVLVIFYGDIKGFLSYPGASFFIGQVILTTVVGKTTENLILSLMPPSPPNLIPPTVSSQSNIKIGQPLSATVSDILKDRLIVKTDHDVPANIPVSRIGCNLNLNRRLLRTYKIGDVLKASRCIENSALPILSPQEAPEYNKSHMKKSNAKNRDFVETGNLSEFYNFSNNEALDNLEHHLNNCTRIHNSYRQKGSPLSNIKIGQHVECAVVKFDSKGCLVTINNSKLQGLANAQLCPKNLYVGQQLDGIIIWVDYTYDEGIVHLVLDKSIMRNISDIQDGQISKPLNSPSKAKILLVHHNFVIAVLQTAGTNNQLILLPTGIHENTDFNIMTQFELLEVIKVMICRKVGSLIIGITKEMQRLIQKILKRKMGKQSANYHKTSQTSEAKESKTKNKSKAPTQIVAEVENSQSDDTMLALNKAELCKVNQKSPLSSGYSSVAPFFTSHPFSMATSSKDSSDDELIPEPIPKKKRSASERAELSRMQENDIRKKEVINANLTDNPQSPDQFDRLLLGNPNSSELWAKYMAYYVVQTEFDKARAIAKRALEAISLSETAERFNIWIILLRFENSHGDQISFDKVFEDAVRSNSDLDVYLEGIKILAESNKFEEMEVKIKRARNKFKHERRMWETIAKVYFENNLINKARDFRDSALKTITNNKDHVYLIVQFALMEFRANEVHIGEALFETLLQSKPKRTDIWNVYIDQVIKGGDIDKARRIFDRAVTQDISFKNKNVLFKKYKDFEYRYGTAETIKRLNEIVELNFGART